MLILVMLAALTASADPVVMVERGRPTYGGVVDTVDVPLDVVRAVVEDCERLDEWFPDMRDTTVVGRVGDIVRCRGVMDLPWPLMDRTWDVILDSTEIEVAGRRAVLVTFTYVAGSGNIEAMSGSYRLERVGPSGRRTRIHYQAWVDLGFWLPQSIVTWATQQVLPGVIRGIVVQSTRAPAE